MFEEGLSRFATSDYKHVTNSNRKVGGRGRVLGVGIGVGVGLRPLTRTLTVAQALTLTSCTWRATRCPASPPTSVRSAMGPIAIAIAAVQP